MKKVGLLLCALICSFGLSAKLVQILHTNDLHSYLESTIKDPKKGGHAYLKTAIEKQKYLAGRKGIPSLVLDAGDFLEGNLFFLADGGKQVMKVMNNMGYDAVVLGNHDWLMGTKQMEGYLEETAPSFPLLAANFKADKDFSFIKKTLRPYQSFKIGGVNLSILGLTTDEIFYKWANDQGKITSPFSTGRKWAKKLKKEGSDFVIGLTHLGVEMDKKLAKKADLDLIVGGHSHTALFKPVHVEKKDGKVVPIVQAGYHGMYLGRLIIDVEKGKPLKVVDYKLIPVDQDRMRPHRKVKKLVDEGKRKLENEYGKGWLYGKVAHSELILEASQSYLTPWSAFLVGVTKEKLKADIAIDSPAFFGKYLPKGPLSRADFFNAYPRIFGLDQRKGWKIWSAEVKGSVVKRFVKVAIASRLPVVFSGVSFDLVDEEGNKLTPKGMVKKLDDLNWGEKIEPTYRNFVMFGIDKKFKLKNFMINGRSVKRNEKYKLALSEGFAAGGLGISRMIRLFLKNLTPTKYTMWEVLTEKFQDMGVMTTELIKNYEYGLGGSKRRPYPFIPRSNLR